MSLAPCCNKCGWPFFKTFIDEANALLMNHADESMSDLKKLFDDQAFQQCCRMVISTNMTLGDYIKDNTSYEFL